MKVIGQLVRHFWELGALTPQDAAYLVRNGYCRPSDVDYSFASPDDSLGEAEEEEALRGRDDEGWSPEDALHDVAESLVRRTAPRGPRRPPRSAEIDVDELLRRVETELESRRPALPSLIELCRFGSPVATWQQAAARLRDARPRVFRTALREALDDRRVALDDLWRATDPDAWHRMLGDAEDSGRTARAYLASLAVAEPSAMGKYGWILKYPAVAAAFDLRLVHAKLAKALRRMLRTDFDRLTRAAARCRDPALLWSLAILFNARRPAERRDEPRHGIEYGPVAPPPAPILNAAWTGAVRIGGRAASDFLIECYGDSESDVGAISEARPFMIPVGWHLPDSYVSHMEPK